MRSIHGYYNGSTYVGLETVDARPNQKVIITLLEEERPAGQNALSLERLESYTSSVTKSIPEGMDAQEYVSKMREDRVF